jgi:hypothetical protein
MVFWNTSQHAQGPVPQRGQRAFDKALAYLEKNADGCPLAAEDQHVDFEVRETLFKTRRGLIYRILFTIRDNKVIILHLRGPGQDFIAAMEVRDPG